MPDLPWSEKDARFLSGLTLLRAGQRYTAARYFAHCIAAGADGWGWFYLGVAQHALCDLESAQSSFAKARAGTANAVQVCCARATVLAELGRLDEAEQELKAALGQAPTHSQARLDLAGLHVRRARISFDLHRDEDALAAACGALELQPANARASLDRVLALSSLHRLDEADEALEQARATVGEALLHLPAGPTRWDQLDPRAVYVGRALHRQDVCDWRDRERLADTVYGLLEQGKAAQFADPGILFRMLALPLAPAQLKAIAGACARAVRSRVARGAESVESRPDANRIRIGFVSPEFRPHPGAWLVRRLFLERSDRFELFAYALNEEDGSAIRNELARAADRFVDVSSRSTGEIIDSIRADRLDLLVDSSGYYAGTRPEILAARVAPVQANFVGTPCTLGQGLLDYRISDALTTPVQTQEDWYEKLVLLPAPHWIYDAQQPIGQAGTRQAHGLPEEGFVFCCFNQAFKLSPEVFSIWMRLLAAVPSSVLWLLDAGDLARANLSREAERAGVAAHRLIFAPRVDLPAYLGRMRHADLFLDTLYCSAHTTAVDALYAGLPVLTRVGDTMASRLAATFVRCAGVPDMVVDSLDAYERKARDLAADPNALSEVRSRLVSARSRSPLFATGDRVRALERAFTAMIERHRAGLPPDTLIID